MARQTRSERRARRAQAAAPAERRTPRAPAVDGGDGGQPPRPPVERGRGDGDGAGRAPRQLAERRGPFSFFHESWGELQKVEWPGQKQVITGTTVVLIACIVVGVYLWANDLVWKHFVQDVLLK